jgi:hypothetical protein
VTVKTPQHTVASYESMKIFNCGNKFTTKILADHTVASHTNSDITGEFCVFKKFTQTHSKNFT